ncbi:MAG: MFS transporter [Candidatus Binatia bacterium]
MRKLSDIRPLRTIRHRNFRLLLEGALISSSGDFMQNVAQSWLVWELTRSPVAIGVVAFFDSMPRLLVGALSGAIADRFDRRRVLLITQTLAMIQAVIYWLAVWFHVIAFWHIVVLAFFLGLFNTINQTARQSLVNSLVPKEELLNAIGLQSSVFNFSKIVGPSLGGVMIASIGIAGCFFVNALSFSALIYNLHLMELPQWEKRAREQSLWEDIKEGYTYVRGNRRIFYIIGLSYVVALFGAPYNRFVPIFATNILQVGPTGFGVLMSAPGLGATIAALVIATIKKTRVAISWICGFVVGFSVSLTLFAFSHIFILSFLFLAMVGFCQISLRALCNTAIQIETPSNLLGRVLSLFFMDRGLWSFGSVLMGAAASAIGINWTFAICALVCTIAASSLFASNSRRRARLAAERMAAP